MAAQLGRKDVVDAKRAWEALTQIAREDRDRIVRKEGYLQLASYTDMAARQAYRKMVNQEPCPTVREFARRAIDRNRAKSGLFAQRPLYLSDGGHWDWPGNDEDSCN